MCRFQFPTLLAGATALALVMAPSAYAQQTQSAPEDAQVQHQQGDAQQQDQMPAGQQDGAGETQAGDPRTRIADDLQSAEQSLDAGNTEEALAALEQAGETLTGIEEALDEPDETVDRLAEKIEEARTSLEAGDSELALGEIHAAQIVLESVEESVWAAAAVQGGLQATGESQPATEGQQATAADQQPVTDSLPATATDQPATATEQQATAADQPATTTEQQATTTAGQQDQQPAEAEVTVTEGQQPAAAGGQVPDATVTETETETETETIVVEEQQAGAEVEQEGEATAESEAEVVPAEEILGVDGEPIGAPAEIVEVDAVELEERNVVTFEGDEIGELESLVMTDGEVHAIIAHGGFLGIGRNRVAVPMQRLGMRGEDVVLLGLSEEQLEALPEFDVETAEAVPEGELLQVGRYE